MAKSTQSLTERVTAIEAGDGVIAAGFIGDAPVLALVNGEVLFDGGIGRRVVAHPGAAILTGLITRRGVLTGGDDGRVVETVVGAEPREIGRENGKWIDALVAREDGAIAWSSGKLVRARDAKGEIKEMTAPSSVRGLCFMPKGYRLAIAHYNGVSLWFPNTAAEPDGLVWRGSHLDVTISPDGRFAVSSMQENSLHGWRIADKKDMRMTGYPTKTRSVSWSHDGKWLATSGAEACIVWPFDGKDGPMGRGPRECCARASRVSRVAFHPSAMIVAVGYDDGWVMLCRLGDGAEILVRSTGEGVIDPVSALAWSEDGKRLVFGCESGLAGVLDLPV